MINRKRYTRAVAASILMIWSLQIHERGAAQIGAPGTGATRAIAYRSAVEFVEALQANEIDDAYEWMSNDTKKAYGRRSILKQLSKDRVLISARRVISTYTGSPIRNAARGSRGYVGLSCFQAIDKTRKIYLAITLAHVSFNDGWRIEGYAIGDSPQPGCPA